MSVQDHVNGIEKEIREMEADFAADPKGAQKERNINKRAQGMRSTLNGFVARLQKFISHD